jgi:hypothetical protein
MLHSTRCVTFRQDDIMLGAPVLPPAHVEMCFFWTLHDRFFNSQS